MGDPVKGVTDMLTRAWGIPVGRMQKFGRSLYVGMVRSGAPKLHFDWAHFDLSEPEVVMQAGVNVYLANAADAGDLRMYRTYGITRGNTASSQKEIVGNYDLPRDLVQGVESCTVPCRAGDLVFAPNRFLHEVKQTSGPEGNRLTLSFHLAWMGDGRLAVFS